MRSTLRSLTFGLAATLAGAAMAQQPYTWVIDGAVSGCYAGQPVTLTVTDGNTQNVLVTQNVTVNPPDCSFNAVFYLPSAWVFLTATSQCNGMVVTASAEETFNFILDTAFTSITIDCGNGNITDCNGVINGPDMPGTPCDDGNPFTWGDLWTPACVCAGIDSTNTVDCLGVPGGPALPGTPCADFLGNVGVWGADCSCQTNTLTDCLGTPGGSALPGTACLYTEDNGNTWESGIWSVDCVCGPDSGVFFYDCLGIANGTNLPGTPCQAFGMVGTWSSDCTCETNTTPCSADFWVLQAFGPDSLPVPYELWVWNLSSGNVVYNWDFGDGSTSTEPFPTHTYSGNGPYNLCLTVYDNNGCQDTHCDTVSINEDGIYEGMPVHDAEDREDGFTINVEDHVSTAVQEQLANSNIVAWPNPATNLLNIALDNAMHGAIMVTITDVDGRVVSSERRQLTQGRNQLSLSTDHLPAGMYSVRILQGANSTSLRFVKAN